jgi:hypothetical protein
MPYGTFWLDLGLGLDEEKFAEFLALGASASG